MSHLALLNEYLGTQMHELVHLWWWYITELTWQIVIAWIAYLCVCVFLYNVFKKVNLRAWQLPDSATRILLVTAHPDDEVMFFGPLIYSIVRLRSSEIYLLCLSNGGSKHRKEELWACTKSLGIKEANVTIVMDAELPDNQSVKWPEDVVAEYILKYVESYKINAVVTFDKHGVSKHKNHISLFYGIASLCIDKRVPPYCKLYVLETVNLCRKYTQLLDLPISLFSASHWYLITYEQRKSLRVAMAAHKSQYVWFRKLYMIFSRYTFINTLQEVNALDLELDFQFDND